MEHLTRGSDDQEQTFNKVDVPPRLNSYQRDEVVWDGNENDAILGAVPSRNPLPRIVRRTPGWMCMLHWPRKFFSLSVGVFASRTPALVHHQRILTMEAS